jgi:hypothetical protein
LNVHNVSGVRQTEIHSAKSLIPGPSHVEVEIATAKLKRYKSPGSEQIPAELIQSGGETLWNKKELLDQWKEFIIIPIHIKG